MKILNFFFFFFFSGHTQLTGWQRSSEFMTDKLVKWVYIPATEGGDGIRSLIFEWHLS